MVNVKVGDKVKVVSGNRNPRIIEDGTVVKVARIWCTVRIDDSRWSREIRFRLDDQTDGSGICWERRFYTLEQWAENERRAEARTFLRDQRISVEYDSPWLDRLVELADAIRAMADRGEGEA